MTPTKYILAYTFKNIESTTQNQHKIMNSKSSNTANVDPKLT